MLTVDFLALPHGRRGYMITYYQDLSLLDDFVYIYIHTSFLLSDRIFAKIKRHTGWSVRTTIMLAMREPRELNAAMRNGEVNVSGTDCQLPV